MASLKDVPRADLTLDGEDMNNGALKILKVIRPAWKEDQVKYMNFTEGISNKMIGCYKADDAEKNDGIVIRVYGEKTDLLIDRKAEMCNMVVLHANGCGGKLYCIFNNGIAYQFIQGICLDENNVRDAKIARLIAKELVIMQAIHPPADLEIDTSPCLFPKLHRFLQISPDSFPDEKKQEKFKKEIRSKEELLQELNMLEKELSSLDSPSVYSHNDLLLKNIVYNEKIEKVTFIDYEYGAFNYEAYDIGGHFCEYAGVDEVDYSRYPNKQYQLSWLRTFIQLRNEQQGKPNEPITDTQVEKLYVQVNKYALTANFFWGVWALIQARYSTIDFDYLDYAVIRFNEYFNRKEEFLSLKMPA